MFTSCIDAVYKLFGKDMDATCYQLSVYLYWKTTVLSDNNRKLQQTEPSINVR